jgi:hypothetical protein
MSSARARVADITRPREVRLLGLHLNVFTLARDKTRIILAIITETHPLQETTQKMAGSSSQHQGRDVVPYQPTQPSTPRVTRSQRQLLSEPLHAGNLEAYLDGISLVDVQSVLSRHFLQNQRDRSIFSYLVEPGDGILPHEAASAVLQELASKTENVAVLATLAYRLIEAKGLWKGHPDPSVKSAEDLIRKLDAGCDVAQANIVIGASALRQRQNYIRLIEEAWRPGWFDDIPQFIRPPAWTRPEDLPRDVLVQITANAKQGIPISTAVARWTEHIERRTDHGRRRREGIKGPTVPYLILSDIKRLNLPVEDADHGRRNVIVREADQYGKRITPARYFRVIIEILRDALSFLLIMPTYSEEDLTNALAVYQNREFTSIRKCAYAFNILYLTLASRLSTRTSRSQSHESQQILSTAEEKTLLKVVTRLSKSGCPTTLPLIRDLAEEIRLSYFRLSSTPTSYPPISKR